MAHPAAIIRGPACEKCGMAMRLVYVVPHPENAHTDLRSYACSRCDETQLMAIELSGMPVILR